MRSTGKAGSRAVERGGVPRAIAVATLAVTMLATLSGCGDPAEGRRRAAARPPRGDFALHGLAVESDGDGTPLLSFRADEMRHRRRRTKEGLFTYQNLTEIELSNVVFEFEPRRRGSSAGVQLEELMDGLLERVAETAGLSDPDFSEKTDIHSIILTRVLFAGLSIEIRLSEGRKLSIVTAHARANADFRNLVFNGVTTVTDADGVKLRAREAIWSREPAGLYLPSGYVLGSDPRREEAFFVISSEGRLSKSPSLPRIEYRDEIEELDDLIYTKVVVEGIGRFLGLAPGR